MAKITDYQSLIDNVQDYLNRDDLTSVVPTWMGIVETELSRRLRDRRMISRATATLDNQYIKPPSTLVALRNIQLNTDPPATLTQITPDVMDDKRASSNAFGRPAFYSHLGQQIEVYPSPDTGHTLEIAYYRTIPAITADAGQTTNWLIEYHPDAYLYGCLKQAGPYLGDQSITTTFNTYFEQAVQQIIQHDTDTKFSGRTPQTAITRIG